MIKKILKAAVPVLFCAAVFTGGASADEGHRHPAAKAAMKIIPATISISLFFTETSFLPKNLKA